PYDSALSRAHSMRTRLEERTLKTMMFATLATLALAVMPPYPESGYLASGQLSQTLKSAPMGNATAIAPRWLISAAHVGPAQYFVQGKQRFKIKRHIPNPDADLALFELEQPVKQFAPLLLLPFGGQSGLKGREFTLVGFGE